MPRALPALPLEDAQRQQLQQWIAAFGTPRQVSLRSQIVLAAAEGEADHAIAQRLQVSRPTVSLWRTRFAQGGPQSLWEIAPGRGRKAMYGPEKIQAIVDATLQSKPKGMTQWSCRLMAEAQGVSKSTISNIWRSHKLELHRVKRFKSSRDPKFLKKITDVMPVEATIAKRIEEFLRRLVAHGNYYEELFDKLCKEGCSSECLAGLLFGVCVIAVGESTGLIDLQEPSISEVRRCARDLRTLADRVGRFNNPRMNPKFDLSTATPSPDLDPGRKHVAHLYDVLPGLMK